MEIDRDIQDDKILKNTVIEQNQQKVEIMVKDFMQMLIGMKEDNEELIRNRKENMEDKERR